MLHRLLLLLGSVYLYEAANRLVILFSLGEGKAPGVLFEFVIFHQFGRDSAVFICYLEKETC